MLNTKNKTKVKCPCGKYHWIPTYYIKRKLGMACSKECAYKFRSPRGTKPKEEAKYGKCECCERTYMTKLGCIFCRNTVKLSQ